MKPDTSMVAEQCSCGAWIFLRMDEEGPYSWSIFGRDAGMFPRTREEVMDSVVAARLMFSRTTVCECGRRYRALDARPWIEPVEEGS